MPSTTDRLDAADSLFFERELEALKARVWERKYPELSGLTLFPLGTGIPAGAETINWRELDGVGLAKVIAKYADDLPRVDVYGVENHATIRGLGDSYGFSTQDIRAARMANKPLETLKAARAKQAIDQASNRICWFGDVLNGLRGFLQTANANLVAAGVAVAAPFGTAWSGVSGKTPAEILTDLDALAFASWIATNGVERPDTLALPLAAYAYISTTPRSAVSDTTILEFWRKQHPEITTVMPCLELAAVALPPSGLAGPRNVAACFKRDDEHLTHEVPMVFTQLPAQARGLEFVVNCEAREGGVIVYIPLAVSFMELV